MRYCINRSYLETFTLIARNNDLFFDNFKHLTCKVSLNRMHLRFTLDGIYWK